MPAQAARNTRQRTIGIAVAACLLLLLGWAATRKATEHSRRSDQAVAALRQSGIGSPRADVQGMVATVYGLAADSDERDRALQAAGRVDGVRDVVDRLTVAAAPPRTPARVVGDPERAPTVQGGARLASPTLAAAPTANTAVPARDTSKPARSPQTSGRVEVDDNDADASCERLPSTLNHAEVAFFAESASVLAGGRATLQSVAQHMLRCPKTVLRIDARATQANTAEANLQLSRLRSQAVSNHLDGHGVAAHRLIATYRGSRAPRGDHADLTMYAGDQR